MYGPTVGLARVAGVLVAGGGLLAQMPGPGAVMDASAPVRASAAFSVVVLLGGGLLWRREPLVARSIDATLAGPLRAMGYGVALHAVVAFGAFYLASQLALVEQIGLGLGAIGLLAGGLLVLVSGATGFTVVGVAVAQLWGTSTGWPGVVLGALLAGGVAGLEPLLAVVGWVAVVSFGIGGGVREWLHASAAAEV